METSGQYFDYLCRTCMSEVDTSSYSDSPQQQWLSIFDRITECEDLQIAELIFCTVPQIATQLSEERPTKICCKCLQQLLSAYRFQQICIQSEEQLRVLISSKTPTDFKTTMRGAALEGEITNDADSYSLTSFQNIGTLQTHLSTQLPLLEHTNAVIKSEGVHQLQNVDKLAEHYKDSQGDFSAFIKNEPIEDDAPNMEHSDGDTMHSTISVKTEELPMDSVEHQINETSSLHKCDLCNKSFKEVGYLKKHLKRHKTNDQDHTQKRPYSCPDCGKSYAEKWYLNRHRLSHSEDKRYECPYCPLRFHSNVNIARHKAIHEGVEQQACDICGKSIRKSELKKHKLIHSTDKPHKCDFCEKRFADPAILRRHMRTHTGEKPYKCKYCERAFGSHGLLAGHLRIHLGDNIYRCELCPLAYRLASELRLHFATHRNEDPETRERNLKALKEEEAKLELKWSKRDTEKQELKTTE